MSYFWVVIILVFCILIGMDWAHFRHLMGPDWIWWDAEPLPEVKDDFTLRNEYRKLAYEGLPDETIETEILDPDVYMENLIAEGRFEEAHQHRLDMVKQAKEQRNYDMLRKYAIYARRIAEGWAEFEDGKVKDLKYRERKSVGEFEPGQPDYKKDMRELIEPPKGKPKEMVRPDWLEYGKKGIPLYPPQSQLQKKEEGKPEESGKPAKAKKSIEGNEDLIQL